jgi:hypothetical protein
MCLKTTILHLLIEKKPENFFCPFFETPEKIFSGKIGAPKQKFAPGPRISLIGPDRTDLKLVCMQHAPKVKEFNFTSAKI